MATITAATNASPIVVTATNSFSNGDVVQITGVTGNAAANGTWTLTAVSPSGFTLVGSAGSGDYISGGDAELALALPSLASGAIAKYGSAIGRTYNTGMVQFVGDQEQRWVNRVVFEAFSLVYTNVNGHDTSVMREFFNRQKGRFVDEELLSTFTINQAAIPGSPYNYCYIAQDDFTATETVPNRFSFSLKIRQARGN